MALRVCISVLCCILMNFWLLAQSPLTECDLSLIINDIYETALEEDKEIDFETVESELVSLAANPINLNCATESDLQRLFFLTSRQIDAILLYVYKHPMESLYELQLVDGLKRYDIRDLLPFVTVAPIESEKEFHWREMWHYAGHEVNIRTDARNIEGSSADPFYVALKYGFQYKQKVQFGIAMERDPAEPWWGRKTYGFDFYSGFLQIDDVGKHIQRIVLGDYRAGFGQGLVMESPLRIGGKSVLTVGKTQEGLRKYHSTGESSFLRGAGITFKGKHVNSTVFYSARRVDGVVVDGVFPAIRTDGYHRSDNELKSKQTVWQQLAGVNLTLHHKNIRIGITATEMLLSDTLRANPNYYNAHLFQGKRQFVTGLNYRWVGKRCEIFGEIAVCENVQWGWANLTGIRAYPCDDVSLVALYRYYSPTYDVLYANGFGESSRNNDESGCYIGTEIKRVQNWRFTCYADAFAFRFPKYGIRIPSNGYDLQAEATWYTRDDMQMQWRVRAKQKGNTDKYTIRYILSNTFGNWTMGTRIEGNIAQDDTTYPSFGLLLQEDIAYQFSKLPIVLQTRLQVFHAKDYNNRFYVYEYDVPYAFSVPSVYGVGGRCYLNLRYHITPHLSLYLKTSHTVYSSDWVEAKNLRNARRTDIHLQMRLRI